MSDIVRVKGLHVTFDTFNGPVQAVRDVSLRLAAGEILGIVGESGCGKSVTVQAMMGLWPTAITTVEAAEHTVLGHDCRSFTESDWRTLRGTDIAMVFQDPMTALNPIVTIGKQLEEVIRLRQKRRRSDQKGSMTEGIAEEVIHLLRQVGIPEPERRRNQYPHELSGGMRQRVVIAMALAGKPKIILADEPTTALDVTTEAQILLLLQKLVREEGMGMIIISHNLRVIARLCDRVAVMYAGTVIEEGSIEAVLTSPAHPYLQGLLSSLPESAIDGTLTAIEGQPPDSYHMPTGCAFHPRCHKAMRICARIAPTNSNVSDEYSKRERVQHVREHQQTRECPHQAACWLYRPEVK